MCTYSIANGTQPICTHECNGCMFYEEDEEDEEDEESEAEPNEA